MPPGSDPQGNALTSGDLPHTWRPLGVRLAAGFFGGILAVVVVMAGILLDPAAKAKFTVFQGITLGAMALVIVVCFHAVARARVQASAQGLVVVNGYRRHEFDWAQVVAIRMPRGAPWATLDLSDGEVCSVIALQSSDGDRARLAVHQIRALIDATSAPE